MAATSTDSTIAIAMEVVASIAIVGEVQVVGTKEVVAIDTTTTIVLHHVQHCILHLEVY